MPSGVPASLTVRRTLPSASAAYQVLAPLVRGVRCAGAARPAPWALVCLACCARGRRRPPAPPRRGVAPGHHRNAATCLLPGAHAFGMLTAANPGERRTCV